MNLVTALLIVAFILALLGALGALAIGGHILTIVTVLLGIALVIRLTGERTI